VYILECHNDLEAISVRPLSRYKQ